MDDNKLTHQTLTQTEYKSFDDYDFLNFELLKGIFEYGFQTPSKIQSLTIKEIYEGHDIIAQSQSGTGKTGAFSIGALSIIEVDKKYPQIIIVATTRELATQISIVIKNLSKHMNINIELCIGGVTIKNNQQNNQQNKYNRRDQYNHIRNAHILVGTPGRLQDYIRRKAFDPKKIQLFIMDEADALLKEDFIEQIQGIYSELDSNTQVCIYSATYPTEILEIANSIMKEPKNILIKREDISLDLIKQYRVDVRQEWIKFSTLEDLYKNLFIGQCIIFVNTVDTAERVANKMIERGHSVGKIHGGLSTEERQETLKNFRLNITRVLIATDILSRGIDVEQIGIIINYDLPRDKSQYIHRIGRSGRFGKIGVAINFITDRDFGNLRDIETHYDLKINAMPEFAAINEHLSGMNGYIKI
jgi:superfamily II DNA/RNA helicase